MLEENDQMKGKREYCNRRQKCRMQKCGKKQILFQDSQSSLKGNLGTQGKECGAKTEARKRTP